MKPFHWPDARLPDAPACYLAQAVERAAASIVDRVHEIDPQVAVVVIDGEACRSDTSLFAEFASKLLFPRYFGHNWDALSDCLNDLDWLPGTGYLIVIERSEAVLPAANDEFARFATTLRDTAAHWATPDDANPWQDPRPLPFRALFAVDPTQMAAMRARLAHADVAVEERSIGEVGVR